MVEFSEDPIPNLRKMYEEFSSGYFKAPSVGAGTANTEFEVLTGMSMRFFGPGEYPYKTYAKTKICRKRRIGAWSVRLWGRSTA